MTEFICLMCGKKSVAVYGAGSKQKFCSELCKKKYHRWKYGYGGEACPYNDGVSCALQECEKCGWNPVVEKMRKELLL